jgi:hypothetical protein
MIPLGKVVFNKWVNDYFKACFILVALYTLLNDETGKTCVQ